MRSPTDGVKKPLIAKISLSATLAALTVLAAAGFSGTGLAADTARTAAVGGYVYAGTAKDTQMARTEGQKAAGVSATIAKGKTIGVIQLSGTSSQSIGVLATARQIAKIFGWKVAVCDPNFDPQKVPQCATSILAQNPAVIFSVSTNTGTMGSAYRDAVAKGIPWISVISGVVPATGLYDYGRDGFELAKIIDNYLFAQMAKKGGSGKLKLFAIGAPTVGIASANSSKQLAKDVKAAGDIQLINHDLDLSNAVQDTLSSTQQTLQSNPDLAGTWTLCDFCLPLMAQVVQKLQGTNRKTVVAGLYANPQAIAGIQKGTIDGVSDYPWLSSVWVGMDQVFEHLARNTPIASSSAIYGKYKLAFMKPYVLTKANIGKSGTVIPVYGPDYQTFFTTKWNKEFGVK
jgi:ABC-type sugar transport system substrate-binding protein